MTKIVREKCKKCDSLIVNGKHYSSGVFDPDNKYPDTKVPEWTDKDIKMVQKYDKKRKAGKNILYTFDEGTSLMDWLDVDDKKDQAYKTTTDKYGNKTYHFRGKPK